jgi:Skp family chaperone for outer membrane proteins
MSVAARIVVAAIALAVLLPAGAQDANIPIAVADLEQLLQQDPVRIVSAEITGAMEYDLVGELRSP